MASVNNFKNNKDLVNYLKRIDNIKSDLVYNTMMSLDRKHFTLFPNKAYNDEPHVVAHGETISSPHMHAKTLELIAQKLRDGGKALDIGSGTGYLSACMAQAIGRKNCSVIGVDCIPYFRDLAKKIIHQNYPELENDIKFVVGDGKSGYPDGAPYDIIVVGAALSEIPQVLIDQLAPGGQMIIPIGHKNETQVLYSIDKSYSGIVEKNKIMNVIYDYMTEVKESDMYWPDVMESVTILNNTMKKVEEKITSLHVNINNEAKMRREEMEKIHKRISEVQKSLKSEMKDLKLNIDKKVSEHGDEVKKVIGNVDSKTDAVESLLENLQGNVTIIEEKLRNELINDVGEKIEALNDKLKLLFKEFKEKSNENDENISKINSNIETLRNKSEKTKNFVSEYRKEWNLKSIEKAEEFKKMIADQADSIRKTDEKLTLKTKDLVNQVAGIENNSKKIQNIEKQVKVLSSLLMEQRSLSRVQGKILKIQQEKFDKIEAERLVVKKRQESEKRLMELKSTVAKVNEEILSIKLNLSDELNNSNHGNNGLPEFDDFSGLSSTMGKFQKEMDILKVLASLAEKENLYEKPMIRNTSQNSFSDDREMGSWSEIFDN